MYPTICVSKLLELGLLCLWSILQKLQRLAILSVVTLSIVIDFLDSQANYVDHIGLIFEMEKRAMFHELNILFTSWEVLRSKANVSAQSVSLPRAKK